MINHYISKYGKRLYGLCITLCADSFDADDLYQETWLRAFKKLGKYDESRPFEAWLTAICVNAYRDFLRRKKRSLFFDNFATSEEKDLAFENTAESKKEDYSDLYSAVDSLPEKFRVTVVLYYFHDLDEKRTAETLQIPLGTVKSRLNKAKKLLRKELENDEK